MFANLKTWNIIWHPMKFLKGSQKSVPNTYHCQTLPMKEKSLWDTDKSDTGNADFNVQILLKCLPHLGLVLAATIQ